MNMEAQTEMKDFFVRKIQGDMNNPAVRESVDWFKRIANVSRLDPEVLTYPNTELWQVYERSRTKNNGRAILYIPIHPVLLLESLGPNPEVDEFDIANALAQVTKTAVWQATRNGIGEIYMPCTDGKVITFAENHGYFRQAYQAIVQEPIPDEQATPAPVEARQADANVATKTEMRDIPFLKMKTFHG